MNKGIILGIGGALVGVVVAFAGFTFFMGGSPAPVEAGPPEVVSVPGKLGPRITLTDRVFNLLSVPGEPAVYLKLQTVIEFETTDERWLHVLTGCGASESHGAHLDLEGRERGPVLVSSVPGGRPAAVTPASGAGAEGDPCEAEQAALLSEFEHEIGSGRELIEDAVTTIVTGHSASEIATPEGKEALKGEIQHAIDELIHEPRVTRVLFLNFITQ